MTDKNIIKNNKNEDNSYKQEKNNKNDKNDKNIKQINDFTHKESSGVASLKSAQDSSQLSMQVIRQDLVQDSVQDPIQDPVQDPIQDPIQDLVQAQVQNLEKDNEPNQDTKTNLDSQRRQALKHNIPKNYLFTFISNLNLTNGIWMIYLAGKGMSLTQLGLLETIFHITSFTMEVPTGAIADVYGRKVSRIMGRFLSAVSIMMLLFADSFFWFALSFVMTALSYNLESGAGDALVYDSMKEIGEESGFMAMLGKKEMVYQAASIFAYFAGGFLAVVNYQYAFGLSIIIAIVALLISFFFKEPDLGGEKITHISHFLEQIKESLLVFKQDTRVAFLIIFAQIISAMATCLFYYLQNYIKLSGEPESSIGMMYALSALACVLVSPHIYKIENKIKEKGVLKGIPFAIALTIWGIALTPFYKVSFVVMMVFESIIFVTLSDYINKGIPSEKRATILSMASMVFSFIMIILFPIVGYIGDLYSLKVAFIALATLTTVLSFVNLTVKSI